MNLYDIDVTVRYRVIAHTEAQAHALLTNTMREELQRLRDSEERLHFVWQRMEESRRPAHIEEAHLVGDVRTDNVVSPLPLARG